MDRVGRYQLLDKLGEGGMGVVYKAYDPLIQRVVAVKLISSARTDDPVLRERFFAEARAAGHLSHRNIVTVYDLGEENERPYFAMEFLEGEDLGRMIRRGAPPTLIDKIDLMAQAGRGLAYAHARGVIHRDVKPANIFVTTTGDVKVLDFGLARLARPVGTDLTRTRPFVGTVSYMAPEQVRGEPADARTDLFAFGVVLYEMLSGGRPAFETDSLASTMHRILTEEPEPLAGLDATLPEELTRIVERALAKSRDERYQRVDEMLADFAAFRASLNAGAEPQAARFTPTPGPRRASLEGLDVTVGHEAAVDVRTPPPRALPASPVPPSPSPTPVSSVPAAVSHQTGRWHAGPGAWVAAAVVVAGIATTVAWLTWLQPQGSAPAGGTTVESMATSGTAGQPAAGGPAVEGPREKAPEAAAVPGGAPSPAAAAPAAPPPPSAPATAERRRGEGEEARRPQRRGEPAANVPAPPPAKSPGPDPAADEAARLLTQNALVEAARARGR
nr:protein kinase [Acidobacteriota bacterium]